MTEVTGKSFEETLNEAKENVKKKDYENVAEDLKVLASELGSITRPIVDILNRTLGEIKNGNCKDPKNDLEFAIIMLEKMKEQKRQNDVRDESQKLLVKKYWREM